MGRKLSADAVANTVTTIPAGAKIPLLTTDPDNKYITAENFAADADFSALYQGLDATLTSIASLGTAADKLAYTTGVDTWAETAFTAFGRSLVDDVDASTAQATLGLVIGTNVQAYSARLTDIAALTPTDGNIIVGNGSTWVAESGSTARTSLGLGTADSPTFAGLSLSGNLSFTAGLDILMVDNSGAALEIKEGANAYMRFVTTNGSEGIEAFKAFTASGITSSNGITVSSGATSLLNTTVTGTLTASSKVMGTDANGYLDLFGDPTATSGVRIKDTGELVIGLSSGSGLNASGTTNSTGAGVFVQRSSGEVFRADAASSAFRIVADQAGTYLSIPFLFSVPTSNPLVAGQVWNDGGTLKLSAG